MKNTITTPKPELTLTIKPAIYLRVSTTEQATEGYGLDAQRFKCLAMVAVKGWGEPVEYSDEGLSGTLDETQRPGLAALLEAIATGAVNAVIVAGIDRLGRSTALVLRMVERMEAGGSDLVSCKESLDTSTAAGRFVLRMFASLAELDRDNIVSRTTDGRNERGKIDGERGGRVPFGYRRTTAGIVIDPGEAVTVRTIFELKATGASLRKIAAALNEAGITSSRGTQWYASSVREVLGNETQYKGGQRGGSPEHWLAILEVTI
jgi:site-specific DNA recombinase